MTIWKQQISFIFLIKKLKKIALVFVYWEGRIYPLYQKPYPQLVSDPNSNQILMLMCICPLRKMNRSQISGMLAVVACPAGIKHELLKSGYPICRPRHRR